MRGLRWVLARRVLRASSGRTLLILLVLAAAGGAAMFGAAGGRRASTAFDRFVAWSQPAHVETGGYGGEVPIGERLHEVAALPSVAASTRTETILAAGVEVAPDRVLGGARMIVVGLDELDRTNERGRIHVVDGELPDLTSTTEGIIDFSTANTLDLAVGDDVRLHAGEDGDRLIDIEITAIVAHPSRFPTVAGWQFNALILMPGFLDAHPELVDPWASSLQIWLRDGPVAIDGLRAEIAELGLADLDLPGGIESVRSGANKITRLEALGLWAAAAVAGAVGIVLTYQLFRREAAASARTTVTLMALGLRRREVVQAAVLRGITLGGVAAALAIALAIAASPRAPLGLARLAEVDTGTHADLAVVGLGALAIVTVAAVASGWATASALALRPQTGTPRGRRLRARGPVIATAAGLARPGAEPGGTRGLVVLGAVLTATACVAVPAVAFGLDGVVDRPARAGGVWDAFAHVDDPAKGDALGRALRAVPEVASASPGGWIPLSSGDQFVFATVYDPGHGIEPAVTRGRAPVAASEVALGEAAMERLGVGLGDTLELTTAEGERPTTYKLEVVGEVIVSSTLFQSHEPDDGIVLSFSFIESSIGEVGWPYLVTFEDGVDPEEGLDAIFAGVPDRLLDFAFARNARADLLAMRSVSTLASWLSALLAGLLVLSVGHLLLVGARAQRGQLAVLRTLGMTAGQIHRVGAAQGALLALVVLGPGLALGAPAGSFGWRAIADSLVVLPTLDWDLAVLVAGTGLLLAASIALGATSNIPVTRGQPATFLRAE